MQPPRAAPIITLTTDFGLSDHYVGTMKGVLLSYFPDARLVDISHEVPAFSIHAGAYTIDQAAPYFPRGTVHLIVIDPGVGTARKPLLLEALGQHFVAPDNGVLSLIFARDKNAIAHEITNRELWLPNPSATFHGRDIFAPVAAAVASGGAAAENVGPLLSKIEQLSNIGPEQIERGVWRGIVWSVDHFGNVITNFPAIDFARIADSPFTLHFRAHEVTEFRPTFGDAAPGLCFAYFGSSGYVEIGINQASAAAVLEIKPGDRIQLRLQT